MLKRILLSVLLCATVFAIVPVLVDAQEPSVDTSDHTFGKAYSDYVNSVEEYDKAHSDYVLKRAQFLKFQSLKSRQDAFDATLLMLQKRDDVVSSYLEVLRIKVGEGLGIPNEKRNSLFFRIDEEKEWFESHKDGLSSAGSLDDLIEESDLAKERWPNITPLSYEAMSILAQGKINDFSKRTDAILGGIKDKLDVIRGDDREGYSISSDKFQVLDRWIFEADGKITRSKDKQSQADLLILDVSESNKMSSSVYNKVVSQLTESQLYMKEAAVFIKEIIKQVKIEE